MEKSSLILEKKLEFASEDLCRSLPQAIESLLCYSCALRFEEDPDYNYLGKLFVGALAERGLQDVNGYDWLPFDGQHDRVTTYNVEGSISLDICNKFKEAVSPKRIAPPREVNYNEAEEPSDDEDGEYHIVSQEAVNARVFGMPYPKKGQIKENSSVDPYESYLRTLPPFTPPEMFIVAKDSHSLRAIVMLIDNTCSVECIVDSGSQIIAISDKVVRHLVSAEEETSPVMVNEYIIPFDPSKLKKPDQELHAFITEENEGKTAESAEKPTSRKGVQTKKKYKPVAKKTKPVATTVSEEFRVVRKDVGDPFTGMLPLNPNPPPFKPGKRFTQD
ncbi:hypothetical protein H0H92_007588 [Tricholoma furcatifolium]|nr:hypothetical protein H0H92_007588 [Tricholoma furcatifolium]